tara:strand:- start:942 stop:1793 length:852 start_codon:yes stop_codon:yes gene_type:complete
MFALDLFEFNKKIEILDIGSAVISEEPIYKQLLKKKIAHLNLFDGDIRQIDKIKKEYGNQNVSVFDKFIFDGKKRKVHMGTVLGGMTSLYEPNEKALNFFNGFSHIGRIEKVKEIQTLKLDDIKDLDLIDFVKLDVQGAELTILECGQEKLKNTLALQLEVSFFNLYYNQPSFGHIDIWMRNKGFIPHCFLDVKKWSISPTIFNNDLRTPGKQLLEADIVYIKDPLKFEKLSNEQLLKSIIISNYCLKSIDLTVCYLIELEKRKVLPKNSYRKYMLNAKKLIN